MSQRDTALITGASRGIGRATALELAKDNVDIVVNYHQSNEEAQTTIEEIEDYGVDATAVQADVADIDQVKKLVSEAMTFSDNIDYLVNNAGAIVQPSAWDEIDQETWERTLNVNLVGAFNCIREVAPHMVENGVGKVVNVTSTYAMMGASPVIAYTAAKAGVISLTKSFATTLAPEVSVNAIAFGNIDTEMTRSAGEDVIDQVVDQTPMDRLGDPQEAAEGIQFLLSDTSDFITGETLIMDGGHRLH
jgi:3-oxoacyl-[acyl-carrier protein] reductase